MAVTRADTLTTTKKKTEYFSDFLNSFDMSPVGNQLARVTNEKSVNQSLRNLILTNLGERLFQPGVGSNILASLFELNTPLIANSLEFYIRNTIENNEPRVNLISVNVSTGSKETTILNKNVNLNENYVNIDIVYNLINNPEQISLNIILKRVR
jgi:phage baseplate assembly protein W